MWSRDIQQFHITAGQLPQKGIHLIEQGVQYAGMIKGAEAEAWRLAGGQVLRVVQYYLSSFKADVRVTQNSIQQV
jgi:hypothetical protein